jgi:hypothetical protein
MVTAVDDYMSGTVYLIIWHKDGSDSGYYINHGDCLDRAKAQSKDVLQVTLIADGIRWDWCKL